jgi:hypothetical protein
MQLFRQPSYSVFFCKFNIISLLAVDPEWNNQLLIGGSNIGKDQMQLNGTKWMLYVGIRAQQSDRILGHHT